MKDQENIIDSMQLHKRDNEIPDILKVLLLLFFG